MYFRKARLDQRPISMRKPDRIECVPISWHWIPSFVSPIATTPSFSRFATISLVMLMVLFEWRARETGEFVLDPSYVRIRVTIEAHSLIGHMMWSSVLHCVTVSAFLSFFWRSKVMLTQSAKRRFGDEWSTIFPSLMNTMLLRHSCFVCRRSALDTFEYSHDRMAQKCAAVLCEALTMGRRVGGDRRRPVRPLVVFLSGRPFCMISVAFVEVG